MAFCITHVELTQDFIEKVFFHILYKRPAFYTFISCAITFMLYYFIIKILCELYIHPLDLQEGVGDAIHKACNYFYLLPKMPRYYSPVKIFILVSFNFIKI